MMTDAVSDKSGSAGSSEASVSPSISIPSAVSSHGSSSSTPLSVSTNGLSNNGPFANFTAQFSHDSSASLANSTSSNPMTPIPASPLTTSQPDTFVESPFGGNKGQKSLSASPSTAAFLSNALGGDSEKKRCGSFPTMIPSGLSNLPKIGKIGVCAMDVKARSKPCRHILNRLIAHGEFETVIFGDKVILDETIENWPTCDFLICFFSNGFPLEKAIDYVKLRRPFLVNDLILQKSLWDRRLVLMMLDANNVPTPERLVISRDGGPRVDVDLRAKLASHGVNLKSINNDVKYEMVDQDTLLVDGKTLVKPFVEKPVDGEDHNVYIYFHSKDGGGGRRLFRKVANKSSEYDPDLTYPREQGSYVYEKFMDTDNFEDVKAYTVGKDFCHAETRKSPVVDGVVRRNTYGKELRFVTRLSEQEIEIAKNVSLAFEQTICGFDLLRVRDKSYVIDVNGFSFVKDNIDYYDNCSKILKQIFMQAQKDRTKQRIEGPGLTQKIEEKQQKWVFKGQVAVIRHADRTPKQKFKYSFRSHYFTDLLRGLKEEVIIREKAHLEAVLGATIAAKEAKAEDLAKLNQLQNALERKRNLPGTKVQLKPVLNKQTKELEKVQLIIKWGGEPTHSARYQAQDLGEQMRQDALLMNPNTLNDIKVFTSSERRVIASSQIWACAFMNVEELPENFLQIRKDLLDDSNAAKDLTDKVKKKLKPLLREGSEAPPSFTWPEKIPQPFFVLTRVVELMRYHHRILEYNYQNKDVDSFQSRWCCGEDPFLFRERWDKLFAEFTSVEKVDPSKISELYDTMKYDGLHNRQFLEKVFKPDSAVLDHQPPKCDIPSLGPLYLPDINQHINNSVGSLETSGPFDGSEYVHLRELYRLAKILFDFICPQEYGIEDKEKLDIGLLTSLPLVKTILSDLEKMKLADHGGAVAYFTKESHIYTLLNVIYESQIPTKIARNQLPELDYLTQITFELYESGSAEATVDNKYSIRLSISPGCNTQSPLDVQFDSKHCISCIPKIGLTRHLDSDIVTSRFRSKFSRISMPEKFIPVNMPNNI